MQRATELDSKLKATEREHLKLRREKDALERWVNAYKGGVDDYEASLREFGIFEPTLDMSEGKQHLKPYIRRILKELQGA
jgi:hypothetical protein